MKSEKSSTQLQFLAPSLREMLEPENPLHRLSETIDWIEIEAELSPLYADFGRPAKPIRLMVGLNVLKHMFSASHIRNILLWLGCRRGRPRPGLRIPFRGRKKFIETIQRLVGRASEREEVFYLDEADIDLNPRIGPCHMKRGRQLVVVTLGKNEKRYVAGAINARTGRVVHTFSRSKNLGLFICLLDRLKAAYRRAEKLHLILDNCIIHKSRRTPAWQRQFGSRIELHFLPPYSPEHNVIERL